MVKTTKYSVQTQLLISERNQLFRLKTCSRHQADCRLCRTCTNIQPLGAFEQLRKATISFVMSICPSARMELLGFHWTDFHEMLYWRIVRKSIEKIVSLKSEKDKGNLREDQFTFLIISRSVLLRMRCVSDKSCRENQKTHFVFSDCYALVRKQLG